MTNQLKLTKDEVLANREAVLKFIKNPTTGLTKGTQGMEGPDYCVLGATHAVSNRPHDNRDGMYEYGKSFLGLPRNSMLWAVWDYSEDGWSSGWNREKAIKNVEVYFENHPPVNLDGELLT